MSNLTTIEDELLNINDTLDVTLTVDSTSVDVVDVVVEEIATATEEIIDLVVVEKIESITTEVIQFELVSSAQQGPSGPQGIQGIPGAQGIQGIQGLKGDKGDPGIAEEDIVYSKRIDFLTDNEIYKGEAAVGSSDSASVWRIRKITLATDGDVMETWANGTADMIHVWTNRLSYTYS